MARLLASFHDRRQPVEQEAASLLPSHLEAWLEALAFEPYADAIGEHLDRYLESPPAHEVEEQAQVAARTVEALPCRFESGGCFLLRPSGEVFYIAWDSEAEPLEETQPVFRWATLVAAATAHPELAGLLAPRPDDALPCDACADGEQTTKGALCAACGGLGWTPAPTPASPAQLEA